MAQFYLSSVLATAFLVAGVSASSAWAQLEGYLNNQRLSQQLTALADSSGHIELTSIGQSSNGDPIHLLTLAGQGAQTETRPAMLIVAGLDGRYLVGTELALRIAQSLATEHAHLLDSMTVYIIPRANPDSAALNFKPLTMGAIGTIRAVDDDRDRMINEDGPEDLNGDGIISLMRRLEPTIDDQATHLADPDDPRLSIKPNAKDGQRASFTLYTEGIDNDGDGQINEDGLGYVDLDQNFMHRWPEHSTHAGRHQLSEPEAMALAQFVIEQHDIVMAVTLGRHDNLVNSPDSKKKDITGRSPIGIDASDVALFEYAAELYQEACGQVNAPQADSAGSFYSWLYAQRGIPSFAITGWGLPEIAKAESETESGADAETGEAVVAAEREEDTSGLTPSGIGDISQETIDELMEAYTAATGEEVDESMKSMITPQMVEQFAAQAGVKIRRIKEPSPSTSSKRATKPSATKEQSDEAKWLAYFEHAEIAGFVDWQPFDHPTLGPVEIGGFKPLSRINPPADQLDELGTKHAGFIVKLMESRAQTSVVGPEVKALAEGLYEVRIAIVNNGQMPTTTGFARQTKSVRPVVVRLSTPVEQIVSGQRVGRIWGLDAHGGRAEYHWIIRTNDINAESIVVIDPRLGTQTIELGN